MNIGNLNVSTRLTIGFSLVLGFLLMIAIISLNRMAEMKSRMDQISEFNDVESRLASSMYLTVTERALALRNLILLEEAAEVQTEVKRITTQLQRYSEAEEQLGAILKRDPNASAELLALFANIQAQAGRSQPFISKGVELSLQKQREAAYKLLRYEYRPVQKKWWELLNDFIEQKNRQNALAIQEAQRAYATAQVWVVAFGALALLIGALASVLIARSLTRQLGGEPRYAAAIANRIAEGDLDVTVAVAPSDTASLLYAMKNMRDSLVRIVGQVRAGTDAIASASGQIARGNLDLSSRTEAQASSLQQTASSMEELTSTVNQNAGSAGHANQLAQLAAQFAVKGGSVVTEVVQTMGAIDASSRRIVDIISVIDSIAFQTNILALNAAVEAARAGEQGRGFAVVASEVRNLAQRSAVAAQEIKQLINESVERVDTGAKLVGQAGSTMDEIVGSINRVTGLMGEILASNQEQAAGIEQINEAVNMMDNMTQQNAALVEQAAAAAAALQDQADELAQLVSTFKLSAEPSPRERLLAHRELRLQAPDLS